MQFAKTGLSIVALMSLVFLFAPCLVHAQEQEPVPWPCRALNTAGRTIIIPCDMKRSADVNLAQSFDALLANRADQSVVTFKASLEIRNAVRPILTESQDDAVALITNHRAAALPRRVAVRYI